MSRASSKQQARELCVFASLRFFASLRETVSKATHLGAREVATECQLLSEVALEELDDTGQSFKWDLVSTRMNIGHKLRAIHSWLCSL